MYRRLVHFLGYHISEFVLANVETGIQHQAQKYRGQIARSLIQEGWIQEGL